jgi:hypothetical protein
MHSKKTKETVRREVLVPVRVQLASAVEVVIRADVDIDGDVHDVSVSLGPDGFEVEAWDAAGKDVDIVWLCDRFGFSSLWELADALTDGFCLDGPHEFHLITRQEVPS